jgi:hypothetical protein
MTDPAMELKSAAAELAAGRGTGPHLTEDEIAAYHAGTLSAAEEARAQDHLLTCPVCTDLLLGREELAGEGEPVPAGEVAVAWQQMRALLPFSATSAVEPAAVLPTPLPFPTPRRTAVPPWFGALAASLLVTVVVLASYAVSLHRERNRPQSVPLFELSSDPLRGGEKTLEVELAPGERSFVLLLRTTDPRKFPRYELEIARSGGAVVWRGDLRRNELGPFILTLPRSLMGGGEYRLRLWGQGGNGREVLGEYVVRIAGG